MEIPKQRWRFELGRLPTDCKIFLNDEQWYNVVSLKVEAGYPENQPIMTKLTLEISTDDIVVEIAPDLQEDIADGLFGKR